MSPSAWGLASLFFSQKKSLLSNFYKYYFVFLFSDKPFWMERIILTYLVWKISTIWSHKEVNVGANHPKKYNPWYVPMSLIPIANYKMNIW